MAATYTPSIPTRTSCSDGQWAKAANSRRSAISTGCPPRSRDSQQADRDLTSIDRGRRGHGYRHNGSRWPPAQSQRLPAATRAVGGEGAAARIASVREHSRERDDVDGGGTGAESTLDTPSAGRFYWNATGTPQPG